MLIDKFKYNPVPRKTVEGKRRYELPDGSKVPSVTTILDATKPAEAKKALYEWKKRVGQEEAKKISREAANYGTTMHKFLEKYCESGELTQEGNNFIYQDTYKMADTIVNNGLCHMQEVWGIEASLYYTGIYAGTTDCVGVWKGMPAVLDFKQTNRPKKEEWVGDYKMQLCAYGEAHNHMFGTDIKRGVILMCARDLTYQEFVIEGSEYNYWMHRWWDRVDQYYTSN